MELLITDVTEMGDSIYCVAGWNLEAQRMVRPLPNGKNWPGSLLAQHGIASGHVITVEPRGTSNGIFPHRTEDTPINTSSIQPSDKVFSDWLGASAPETAADLRSGFSGHLRWNKEWKGVKEGAHVLPRTQCSSLLAVRIPRSSLLFEEAFGKLKARLNDGTAKYQFTVSSTVLKEAWRSGGLAAVNGALPNRDAFHVRIGLARPYDNPPRCYAMLNGVL